MSFNPFKSHRSEILKKVATEHKALNDGRYSAIQKSFNYLSQKDKYWLVFIVVLFFFSALTLIQFDALSFISLKKGSAETLIDQRTSNVATIISMTLAVIGLLLSNLAVKDDQTYKLLFVNSKVYLIIYYTLSVIFCLIIISTLRDTVDEPFYQRMVVAGTYMALLILAGIAYLFKTIINFTNAVKIQNTLSEQLMAEAKNNLKINLLSKYSQIEFEKFLTDNGIIYLDESIGTDMQVSGSPSINNEKLIYNINFKKLGEKLNKRNDRSTQFYFRRKLHVNLITKDYNNFISPIMKQSPTENISFSDCFKLKSTKSSLARSDEYKKYFDKKLHEYSAEGKHGKVEEILAIYADLYKLNMEHE